MEADVKRALTALRRERAGADEAGARRWIDERGGDAPVCAGCVGRQLGGAVITPETARTIRAVGPAP
jgi:hypothetical protein